MKSELGSALPSARADVASTRIARIATLSGTRQHPRCADEQETSSPREDSNFRQAVYGTAALPLCYGGKPIEVVGSNGWLGHPRDSIDSIVELATGVEPASVSVAH